MIDKMIEDILQVRDTGRTNMFDIYAVERIAFGLELYDLVIYLEEKDNWESIHTSSLLVKLDKLLVCKDLL